MSWLALPQNRILLTAIIGLAVMGCAVVQATHLPAIDAALRVDGDRVHLELLSGEAAQSSAQVAAIATLVFGDSTRLPLRADDLLPEPDMAFASYTIMDAFFDRQTRLTERLLGNESVRVELTDGRQVERRIIHERSVTALPRLFWFQLFCAYFGLIAGVSVWAFRPGDPATPYYALTGLGMLLFASAAAIYSTRPLAMSGDLFATLSAVNQAGALLFCAGLLAVLWYYPTRLAAFPFGPVVVAVFGVCGLLIPLRLIDSVSLVAHSPILIGYTATYGLAALQWRRTRYSPYDRAALKAFLLAWLFGSGAFLAVIVLPAQFGVDNGDLQGYAFGFFLLIYLGVAVGVLRYKLFRLDRWWFASWAILLGGLAVTLVDAFLVYALSLDFEPSTMLSLALVGWVYFPVRQWIWGRLARPVGNRRQAGLIQVVTEVLSSRTLDDRLAWARLLERVFSPQRVTPVDAALARDQLLDSGSSMQIAGFGGIPGFRLDACAGGTRLFSEADLVMTADLKSLFGEIIAYRRMLEEGVNAERNRVARDLHDDVGARLLTLTYRLREPEVEQARAALGELRSVVYSMRGGSVNLSDLLADWRAEALDRCDAAQVALVWQSPDPVDDRPLDSGANLALTRIFREVLTNALKHGKGGSMSLRLEQTGNSLACELLQDYSGPSPERWTPGLGLHNLRARVGQLDGRIDWLTENGQLKTVWSATLGVHT